MIRFSAAAAAAALLAAPALAGTYRATPADPAQPDRVVARDIAWSYSGGVFTGRTADSRPMVLCQGLAKRAGPLTGFSDNGRAFSSAELAKCNGFAPSGSASAANAN